ncbi:DUF202 domain-containing protein [Nocardia sp. NPDC059229]|uniref:DUF202 domain-containing protein n=1 Tax=Nocardia sp. NPDC059229 TaxID=3346778 RepID=UPI0036CB5B76
MSTPAIARDPGLATERTALAWRRTAISAIASAALFTKVAAEGGIDWRPTGLLPLSAAVVMMLVAAIAMARSRSLHRGAHRGAHRGTGPLLLLVSAGVAAVGLAALAMVLTHS